MIIVAACLHLKKIWSLLYRSRGPWGAPQRRRFGKQVLSLLVLAPLALWHGDEAQAVPGDERWLQALRLFDLVVDISRQRDLAAWRGPIADYSERHYGERTWVLRPTAIVLHYTAGTGFPSNLVGSTSAAGETPGLSCHFVVDANHVWQILPPTYRSRGAYGINHRAINIEMVARDARDLAERRSTLATTASLVAACCRAFAIPLDKVYGHQDVATMDRQKVPEVFDRVSMRPYGKIDPGRENLRQIKAMAASLLDGQRGSLGGVEGRQNGRK